MRPMLLYSCPPCPASDHNRNDPLGKGDNRQLNLARVGHLPRAVTLPPGSAWCRSRCRPAIVLSSGASASATIAIYARC